jgi:DNA modification methylase
MKQLKWNTSRKKLKDIFPTEYNPRRLTEKQYNDLNKSLKKFGLVEIPAINKDGTILAGHQRCKVLLELEGKEKEIDVRIPNRQLTKKEADEYLIRSNKNSGEWNYDILANEFDLKNLQDWGFEEKEFDFEIGSDLYKEEEKEMSSLENKSITKKNDLWLLGNHRLLCGDSTNIEDVNKLMDGRQSELLFTSPPYSDMRTYNGNKDLSCDNLKLFISNFYHHCNYQCINFGLQTKNHSIYEYYRPFIEEALNCNYLFLSWNVWDKEGTISIGNQAKFFPIHHEWIFVFGKKFKDINRTEKRNSTIRIRKSNIRNPDGSNKCKNSSGMCKKLKELGSVFRCSSARTNETDHPAIYPIELPRKYIEVLTDEENIIVDPFLGSGTTLIASEQTNRKCYGMEIDEHYCDVIIKRWQNFTGKDAVLEKENKTFNELNVVLRDE